VVAHQQQHVVRAQRRVELREARVEGGQRGAVARRIAPVTVGGVEVHQVGEDEALAALAQRRQGGVHALLVRAGLAHLVDARAVVDVADLADRQDRPARLLQGVQDRAGRVDREVAPLAVQPFEGARLPLERSGDHARHGVGAPQQLACGLAPGVERLERDDVHVRGDLEDAVGAGVDDRLSARHVVGAQLVQDRGAAGCAVAEVASPRRRVEVRHQLVGKALEGAERRVQHHAHELPVTGRGVLAGRALGHPTEGAARCRRRRDRGHARDPTQTQARQVRQGHPGRGEGVVQRVGPGVAERLGVRQGADAHRVEHDHGHRHAGSLPTAGRMSGVARPRLRY